MRRLLLLAGAAALAFSMNSVLAQDAGKAKAKPKPSAARTAASIECSKQADAKGLHGKERRTFRARCRKDLGKTAKSKA
jgi:hypothetical protein